MKHSDVFDEFYHSDAFQKIALEFVKDLPNRLANITNCIQNIRLIDDLDSRETRVQIKALSKMAHSLSGTAGSVGFQSLTIVAKEFETLLNGILSEESIHGESIIQSDRQSRIFESIQSIAAKLKSEIAACHPNQ